MTAKEKALEELERVYAKHKRVTLFCSGGKDSVALLLLCEPWWDQTDVVFINTGDQFPEIEKFMRRIQKMVPYYFAMASNSAGFVGKNGWPVDVVPERYTPLGRHIYGETDVRFCSRFHCCQHNIWEPMAAWIKYTGTTCVIRGDREIERAMGPLEAEGVEFSYPIWEMDAKDIRQIIRNSEHNLWENRFDLDNGSSLDCMHCFAYFEDVPGKLDFAKNNHPFLYKELATALEKYKAAINEEMEKLNGV